MAWLEASRQRIIGDRDVGLVSWDSGFCLQGDPVLASRTFQYSGLLGLCLLVVGAFSPPAAADERSVLHHGWTMNYFHAGGCWRPYTVAYFPQPWSYRHDHFCTMDPRLYGKPPPAPKDAATDPPAGFSQLQRQRAMAATERFAGGRQDRDTIRARGNQLELDSSSGRRDQRPDRDDEFHPDMPNALRSSVPSQRKGSPGPGTRSVPAEDPIGSRQQSIR